MSAPLGGWPTMAPRIRSARMAAAYAAHQAIAAGDFDDDLESLATAIKFRLTELKKDGKR